MTLWTEERPFRVSDITIQAAGSPYPADLGVYSRALSTGLIQKDVEQIIVIALAGAGAERRKAEANPEGDHLSC